jgi:hypothetical protein
MNFGYYYGLTLNITSTAPSVDRVHDTFNEPDRLLQLSLQSNTFEHMRSSFRMGGLK